MRQGCSAGDQDTIFDHFPEEALELADQIHFPLFFLNNALGFIEAVYPVMVAIVEAKNGVEMRTRYQIGKIEKKNWIGNFILIWCRKGLTGRMRRRSEPILCIGL